jgi:hypothetical protein
MGEGIGGDRTARTTTTTNKRRIKPPIDILMIASVVQNVELLLPLSNVTPRPETVEVPDDDAVAVDADTDRVDEDNDNEDE